MNAITRWIVPPPQRAPHHVRRVIRPAQGLFWNVPRAQTTLRQAPFYFAPRLRSGQAQGRQGRLRRGYPTNIEAATLFLPVGFSRHYAAFFNTNGWIGILLLLFWAFDIVVRRN